MKKDSILYIQNMLEKAEEARAFCKDKQLTDFLGDDMLQSAVVLKLIVVGEEARKVPDETRSSISIPWPLVVGFRNMAVHEYFDLDLELVWTTVQQDLPPLIDACRAYLDDHAMRDLQ